MSDSQNIFSIVKKIEKGAKTAESYNTGLLGEQMIVSAYHTMPLDKLEKLRFIINKIIKKKKEQKAIKNAVCDTDNN